MGAWTAVCRGVGITDAFPASPWMVGFGGHLTQFGNHLLTPEVSEEDIPSAMANTRQVPAKLTRSAPLLMQPGGRPRGRFQVGDPASSLSLALTSTATRALCWRTPKTFQLLS